MLDLKETQEGVVLQVRAHAGARRNALEGIRDGALRVSVTQQPENGKANKAIAKLLAKRLKIASSKLQLLSGATHSRKKFLVLGATLDEIRGLHTR